MNLSQTIGVTALLAALTLAPAPSLAAISQEASTFSAGGGDSTSSNYANLGVIGQPGIVGSSSSSAYKAEHGFLPVLGGWKILYPVISATPGTLTFSLLAGTTGSRDISITNVGGSTLNWTVTKGTDTNNIFGISPGTGINSGNITVTANAAGLTPGPYSSSMTISGAGIEQTILLNLDLTVTPANYTLAVTLKLATPGKGGGTVTSTSAPGISCIRSEGNSDVTCSHDFPANSTVTLSQTPGSDSQWATWGAPGCGSNPTCQIVLDAPKGTDVIFPYSSMAKVNSTGSGYESLVSAYGGAGANDTIKARAVTFSEGGGVVNLGGNKTINLVGGLDAYFNAQSEQFTTIRGRLNIGGTGRVNIKGIKVRP